jgi:hypothetical protein
MRVTKTRSEVARGAGSPAGSKAPGGRGEGGGLAGKIGARADPGCLDCEVSSVLSSAWVRLAIERVDHGRSCVASGHLEEGNLELFWLIWGRIGAV